jgi:hypothetical protein
MESSRQMHLILKPGDVFECTFCAHRRGEYGRRRALCVMLCIMDALESWVLFDSVMFTGFVGCRESVLSTTTMMGAGVDPAAASRRQSCSEATCQPMFFRNLAMSAIAIELLIAYCELKNGRLRAKASCSRSVEKGNSIVQPSYL